MGNRFETGNQTNYMEESQASNPLRSHSSIGVK